MTDYIGPVPLHVVEDYQLAGHTVTLMGHEETWAEFLAIRELCQDFESAVVRYSLNGRVIAEDPTENKNLIQYCRFDATIVEDGYYIITGFQYLPQFANYYPYQLTLVFIGSQEGVYEGLDIFNLVDVANDWE
jgi:hypothetical protein